MSPPLLATLLSTGRTGSAGRHSKTKRCLTVRVGKDQVRRLISNGYLSLESSEKAAAVAIALEALDFGQSTLVPEIYFEAVEWIKCRGAPAGVAGAARGLVAKYMGDGVLVYLGSWSW
jgi:hypothetical protein